MKEVIMFGSPLVRYEVDMSMVDELNRVSDFILKNGVIPPKYDYTQLLASAIDLEYKIPFELIEEVKTQLEAYALDFHNNFCDKVFNSPTAKTRMLSCWGVSQRPGEWNYLHRHTSQISGVMYLKVPSDMTVGVKPGSGKSKNAGSICFTEGGGSHYKRSMTTRQPKVGDLYIFPSDLLHTVYPFFGTEERRSFSFNFAVDL
ncbi:MAG: 2OG-Fe(II) oxygenase family protein [Proteobacteria bacterium]|jgi:uncharacterized protein (TIGR02466 family)|nr:2OG-Fe(II) oxygenase family protein [Pseudomonadota bacterium]